MNSDSEQMTAMLEGLTLPEVKGMTLLAGTELANRWIPSVPGAAEHIAAGAGLELVMTLRPAPGLSLVLVDSDGTRYPLAWQDYKAETKH